MIRLGLLMIMLISFWSCAPSAPYEIRSPCVAAPSDNPYHMNPCIRRPANILHDLA